MLLEKIIAKLRAIPALGVVRNLTYKAKGVVERIYQPYCFFINYDGINQLVALPKSAWLKAIDMAAKHCSKAIQRKKSFTVGKFFKCSYDTVQGTRVTTHEVWSCKVLVGECDELILTFSASELTKAIEYGLKVSEQNPKFRINWFTSYIRKFGMWLLYR